MDLTPKQQTSEAIRQAETILITTGRNPSVDQTVAVIALAAILRKFGKKVSAVVSDGVPQSVQTLDSAPVERGLSGMRDFVLKLDVTKAEVDKLRYEVQDGKLNIFITPFKGGFAPSDVTFDYGDFHYDLAIVLGVPTRSRIDRVYDDNRSLFEHIPVVNLDFHRSNEGYGAVNLIEPNASSLCEMLVALAESLQGGIIDADIATVLLTGIMASTDRFTASHTTSKSLTVAAQMMAAGGRQQAVVKALYRDGRGERDQARGAGERGRGERSGQTDRAERNGGRGEQRGERNNNERNAERTERSTTERNSAERGAAERSEQPRTEARVSQPATESRAVDPAVAVARSLERSAESAAPTPRAAEAAPVAERPRVVEESRATEQPRVAEQPRTTEQARATEAAAPERVVEAPRAAEVASVPEPTPTMERPVQPAESEQLPIIQPGHIELSEPTADEMPPAPEPVMLKVPPMADFAAAAEVLHQEQAKRPESPEGEKRPTA